MICTEQFKAMLYDVIFYVILTFERFLQPPTYPTSRNAEN